MIAPIVSPAKKGPGRIVMVPIATVITVPMIMIIIISEVLACITTVIHPVGAFSLPGFAAVGAFSLTRFAVFVASFLAVSSGISSIARPVGGGLTAAILPGASICLT